MKIKDIINSYKLDSCNYSVERDICSLWEWIEKMQKELNLKLQPDFQRKIKWDNQRCIDYIEYILKNGQSGRTIYFNFPGWKYNWKGEFVLVDGQQRLEAFRKFLHNEIPIFGNIYYKDIEDKYSLGTITIKIHNLQNKKDVLKWYYSINAGGIPHTKEELEKVERMIKELE